MNTYTLTLTAQERETLISATLGLQRTAQARGDAVTSINAGAVYERLICLQDEGQLIDSRERQHGTYYKVNK